MPLPLRGRTLSGKFEFVRRLGKGGMASVWLAMNTAVDREVAIKVIRPEVLKDEALVARFRSEAKAAGRIGHPNVCEILDFGVGPIGPYIVMECLRGTNLAQRIRERGNLSADEAVQIVLEALEGLEAAHNCGIVHRDLKPDNVFLHEPVTGPTVVKLMDFGVAKFTDGSAEITTEHGALLGTPEYMAPEQFKGAALATPRTDVWAVGAILYRALTGRHPFKGPTVAATLLMVTHDDPVPLRELAPDVPRSVDEVIARCLSKQPEDRFASVAELRDALEAAMAVEPPPPIVNELRPDDSAMERRPTEAYRVTAPRPRARAPWLFIGGGALVVLLLAAVVALWSDNSAHPPAPASTTPTTTSPEPPPVLVADIGTPKPEPAVVTEPNAAPPAALPSGVPPPPDAFGAPSPTTTDPKASEEAEELPAGVVDIGGGFVLAKQYGAKRTDHGDARKYCETLGVAGHMGFSGWKLPFPGLAKRIEAAGGIARGVYWTSARWQGNVTTFSMPGGELHKGVDAERRAGRAICVAGLKTRQPDG